MHTYTHSTHTLNAHTQKTKTHTKKVYNSNQQRLTLFRHHDIPESVYKTGKITKEELALYLVKGRAFRSRDSAYTSVADYRKGDGSEARRLADSIRTQLLFATGEAKVDMGVLVQTISEMHDRKGRPWTVVLYRDNIRRHFANGRFLDTLLEHVSLDHLLKYFCFWCPQYPFFSPAQDLVLPEGTIVCVLLPNRHQHVRPEHVARRIDCAVHDGAGRDAKTTADYLCRDQGAHQSGAPGQRR